MTIRHPEKVNNPINPINYVAIEDQSAYEERLRLLYVALTRAKEQVYLVTVAKKSAVKNYFSRSSITKSFASTDSPMSM